MPGPRRCSRIVLLLCLLACGRRTSPAPEGSASAIAAQLAAPGAGLPAVTEEQLAPFVAVSAIDPAVPEEPAAKLGHQLFFDERLAARHDVSCSSCHDLARAGTDGLATSVGGGGRRQKRNTPGIFGAASSFAQGWEADEPTLEAFLPKHLVDVLGGDPTSAVAAVPAYAMAFAHLEPPQKPSAAAIGGALAAFVRGLRSRGRWDRYLEGDRGALSVEERGGLATFVEVGCPTCHQGVLLGGRENQRLGIARPWPGPAGAEPTMFKIPGLRDVRRTGPWLHDGSLGSLDEVVLLMARHQLGHELSAAQVVAITSFLGALDGSPDPARVARPALPPGGAKPARPGR